MNDGFIAPDEGAAFLSRAAKEVHIFSAGAEFGAEGTFNTIERCPT
jgi:hypothetical protein